MRPSVDGQEAEGMRREAGGGWAHLNGVGWLVVVVVVLGGFYEFSKKKRKKRKNTSNEINTISIRLRGKSLEPHSYFSHVFISMFLFSRIDFRAFSQFSGGQGLTW